MRLVVIFDEHARRIWTNRPDLFDSKAELALTGALSDITAKFKHFLSHENKASELNTIRQFSSDAISLRWHIMPVEKTNHYVVYLYDADGQADDADDQAGQERPLSENTPIKPWSVDSHSDMTVMAEKLLHQLDLIDVNASQRQQARNRLPSHLVLGHYLSKAQSGDVFSCELDVCDADGRYRKIFLIGNPQGAISGCASGGGLSGFMHDITDEVFQQERTQIISQMFSRGRWEYLINRAVVRVAPELQESMGYQGSELEYDKWLEGIHADDVDKVAAQIATVKNLGGETKIHFRMIAQNTGVTKNVQLHIRYFLNTLSPKEPEWLLGSFIELDSAAPAVSENAELGNQITSQSLVSLADLATGIGHEINNPLAILVANLDFLKSDIANAGNDTPQISRLFEKIGTSTQKLGALSQSLRRLANSASSKAEAEVDLSELLSVTVTLMSEILGKLGISLSLDVERRVGVFGYFAELQQLFLNLISNARNAVESCDEKVIEVKLETDNERCVVRVSDTGVGIAPLRLKKLFQNVYTEKPSVSGVGVGLGICKKIVDAHGGTIHAESTLGEGSCFVVSFPTTQSQQQNASTTEKALPITLETKEADNKAASTKKTNEKNKPRILVVDDEPLLLDLVSQYLKMSGYDVFATSQINIAKTAFKTAQYQVLITDICMPEEDGYDLINYIDKEYGNKVKVIIMTGGTVDSAKQSALAKRVSGYLFKPFTYEELMNLVEELDPV